VPSGPSGSDSGSDSGLGSELGRELDRGVESGSVGSNDPWYSRPSVNPSRSESRLYGSVPRTFSSSSVSPSWSVSTVENEPSSLPSWSLSGDVGFEPVASSTESLTPSPSVSAFSGLVCRPSS
jgi:hypothetical protein